MCAYKRGVFGFCLMWKCLCKEHLEDVGVKGIVLTPVHVHVQVCTFCQSVCSALAQSAQRAGTSSLLRRAVSRARITYFKESHCHTLMCRTTASATEISAH